MSRHFHCRVALPHGIFLSPKRILNPPAMNRSLCGSTLGFAYKGYTFPAQIMVRRKTEYTHLASVRLESHYFCFLCSVNDHLLYCFPCCHIVMYQYFGICLCHFSLRLFPRSNLEIVNGRLLSWSRICL